MTLTVSLGEQAVYHGLRYLDQVTVNVVGVWRKGCAEPLWVMSNLSPERALSIYAARMKIEESFRDLKSLLRLDKLMNKSQQHMEQMAALVMLAFAIGSVAGETLRDALYGAPETAQTEPADPPPAPDTPQRRVRRKWQLYSGLFLVLKHKITLPARQLRRLHAQAASDFARLVQPLPVQT